MAGSAKVECSNFYYTGLNGLDGSGSKHIKRFDINTNGDNNIVDYTGLKEAA